LLLDLRPRLASEPILQASRHGCPRPKWTLHHDLAILQSDEIPSRSGQRPFDTNTCELAPEKYLAFPSVGDTYLAQSIDPLKLIEDPFLVLMQECRYIVVGSIERMHDLDSANADPDTELTG
jgi:hypothetical protein